MDVSQTKISEQKVADAAAECLNCDLQRIQSSAERYQSQVIGLKASADSLKKLLVEGSK